MININLNSLSEKFKKNNSPVAFDFRSKFENEINDHFKDGKKYLHYLHSYPGRISPHIPFTLLSLNEFKNHKGKVLDPFAGTGTVLLESIINPYIKRIALGAEINPLARLISKVKTTNYDLKELKKYLIKIKKTYEILGKNDFNTIEFLNIDLWFSLKTKSQLSKLKFSILHENIQTDYKDFFWVCFSKIIRKVSKADPRIPPPVVIKPEKFINNLVVRDKMVSYLAFVENPSIWELFEQSFNENCKLASYKEKEKLYSNNVYAKIICDNAQKLKVNTLGELGRFKNKQAIKLPKNSIEIVVTSPPYISAQKYIRSTKLELFWLGYTSEELIMYEKNSIGSEYVSLLKKITDIHVESIDELISWTYKKSAKRGIEIFEFFVDMKELFSEIFRVLKKNGYAIFIIGDNHIINRRIKTYNLLSKLASSVGFEEVLILKDLIRNRSMITKRNGTGGLIKNEYILILHKSE